MSSRIRWGLAFSLCLNCPASLVTAADCDLPFSEVFRKVSPSVVQILTVNIDPFSLTDRIEYSIGSGFVVDDQGHVVTNAHVVHGANQLLISVSEDEFLPGELVGLDAVSDLAVVKPASGRLSGTAVLGRSDQLSIGDEVLAIGYPFGIGKTATRGIVSAIDRIVPFSTSSWMTPFIQTDSAISPGNSGGPLVNRCAEVVAVNTLGSQQGQHLNFSIPVDTVRQLVPELIKHGRVIRAWHGINGVMVPYPLGWTLGMPYGYMVETIEPGSPAETIGLRGGNLPVTIGNTEFLVGGDVITQVNGEAITDMDVVFRIAKSLKVGDRIKLDYVREGRLYSAEVVLPERPALPGDANRFRR